MSTTATPPVPVTESAATATSGIETGIKLGLQAATVFAGPYGPAASAAIVGIFAAYDAIMAHKPAFVSDEEWRAYLTKPILVKTGDDYINEAKVKRAQ